MANRVGRALRILKALGLYDRIGSVEAGKKANLVFTDEDFLVRKVIFAGNEIREVRTHPSLSLAGAVASAERSSRISLDL